MRIRFRISIAGLCLLIAIDSRAGANDVLRPDQTRVISGSSEPPKPVRLQGEKVDGAALKAKAKTLRAKTEQKPSTKEAKEAEMEEAQVLIKLTHLKDKELDDRRHQLVEKLKKDETVPAAARFRLVGLSTNAEVAANRELDPDQRLEAYQQAAWGLVKDFPENPEGYASLVRIARDSSDAEAAKISQALLDSKAPETIKQAARQLQQRGKLLGQPLAHILDESLALGDKPGRICLFTWSCGRPESLALASRLKEDLPEDCKLIAVCLDGDTENARAVAQQQKVPARVVFPEGGRGSRLCQELVLSENSIYLTDGEGRIVTTSFRHQMVAKHWQQRKEAKNETANP